MTSLTKRGTGEGAYSPPRVAGRRYEAVLRLSEALSQCRDPEDLTAILSEELREFLPFLQFYIVLYRENSDEVEWGVIEREKKIAATYADVPVQERPSRHAYKTQEPFHIRDWDTDERVPENLKKGVAALGLDVGPLVCVPLTTPHRRLGALGVSGPLGTVYTSEDVSFLQLIGRVVALRISDSFNLRQAEAARLELERQNDRLQRTERELREVIETIPCLAWTATADGNAEFFNRRWLEYAGLTAHQAQGTGWTTTLHPSDLSGLVSYWQRILASSQPGEFEARLRRFDGEYRWFLFRATPRLDENGKVIKWYGTNIDIEERKRAEQDLRRSEAYLAEAQRLTQTGSCAIHGTSRETLYWSEEMFRLFGFDPQQGLPRFEQWVQRIHPEDRDKFKLVSDRTLLKNLDCDVEFGIVKPDGTVRHIHGIGHPVLSPNGELVQAVGTMVDITDRKDSSHQEMVDVNELIQEMIVMLRDEANRHSVTTRTDLADGLPKVMADHVQLQQALMNLMLNGIEAMRETTGELSVKSRLAENCQVLVSVTDAGVGLPNEKTDQIFTAFFTTKPHGTGLGLAITRSIIESHGGRVWATANSGRGTTFHFTLPRRVVVIA